MNFLKEYKGVILMFLVITVANVIWVVSYDNNKVVNTVNKDRNIVLNA